MTTLMQGTFSTMTFARDRSDVFAHVNQFICSHSDMHRYATPYFGILDLAGRLEFINAGHPPPLPRFSHQPISGAAHV